MFASFFRRWRVGKTGEDLAADALARRGYRLVERNYRGRGGEIDLVARENDEWVFVEVKTRTNQKFGRPEEAVGARKKRGLRKAAAAYCAQHKIRDAVVRCDVVAILLTDAAPEITVFKDAVALDILL
ncbi:UPF0102 protein [Planctomycetales bacterium]|nr:UPF0102 protein [Planctomycetales bacterium]GHT00903.1 UPF0102 protein [Planctomycetales bacterium]GHT08200.1 UPF0102 protein [Planctomycetales bacterium]GHV22720.1 UPF0102 protein [Planctomycetales bacterium]